MNWWLVPVSICVAYVFWDCWDAIVWCFRTAFEDHGHRR